jgi:hypothetical protein
MAYQLQREYNPSDTFKFLVYVCSYSECLFADPTVALGLATQGEICYNSAGLPVSFSETKDGSTQRFLQKGSPMGGSHAMLVPEADTIAERSQPILMAAKLDCDDSPQENSKKFIGLSNAYDMLYVEHHMHVLRAVLLVAIKQETGVLALKLVGRVLNRLGESDLLDYINNREINLGFVAKDDAESLGNKLLLENYANEQVSLAVSGFEQLLRVDRLGYQHRDIKPENFVVNQSTAMMYCIDFETVQAKKEPHPSSQRFVYTPGYVAPEVVVEAGCNSAKQDVYAFAFVLLALFFPDLLSRLQTMLAEGDIDTYVEGLPNDAKEIQQWLDSFTGSPAYTVEQEQAMFKLILSMSQYGEDKRRTLEEAAHQIAKIFPQYAFRIEAALLPIPLEELHCDFRTTSSITLSGASVTPGAGVCEGAFYASRMSPPALFVKTDDSAARAGCGCE